MPIKTCKTCKKTFKFKYLLLRHQNSGTSKCKQEESTSDRSLIDYSNPTPIYYNSTSADSLNSENLSNFCRSQIKNENITIESKIDKKVENLNDAEMSTFDSETATINSHIYQNKQNKIDNLNLLIVFNNLKTPINQQRDV